MEFFKNRCIALLTQMADTITSIKVIILNILALDISSSDIAISAIEAAALSLAGLFLAMEMISMISEFRFERIEDAIRLWIKVLIAKIIIENSSAIIGGIYDLFRNIGTEAIESGFEAVTNTMYSFADPGALLDQYKGMLGEGWILTWLFLLLLNVVVAILMMKIAIEVFGIAFEIGIHQAVGPVAISTLCNSAARSTGVSFIKSYSAVCLQTTVIGVIFKIYSLFADKLQIGNDVIDATVSNGGVFGIVFAFFSPILGLTVLCVAVSKSGDLTKRMFGA